MNLSPTQQSAWTSFLTRHQLPQSTELYECFYFGLTKAVADELLELVLKGQKRATSSALASFIDREAPQVDDYSMLISFEGEPKAIIQTKQTMVKPFNEMTYDIVKAEGEDDTLQSWQDNHQRFFSAEGKLLGYTFSETLAVLFEWFDVIEIL